MTIDGGRLTDYYDQEEIKSILYGLSKEELKAISITAHIISKAYPELEGEDLIADVTISVLKADSPRRWPRNLPPKVFFMKAMQSYADNNGKKSLNSKGITTESDSNKGENEFNIENIGDKEQKDHIERSIDATAKLNAIQDYFMKDADVMALIVGRMEGLTEVEIKDKFNIRHNKYESARKRLVRGLIKMAFKE